MIGVLNKWGLTRTQQHIRHEPVLSEGQLVGIISIGDVVQDIIAELRFMIEQLENYIARG